MTLHSRRLWIVALVLATAAACHAQAPQATTQPDASAISPSAGPLEVLRQVATDGDTIVAELSNGLTVIVRSVDRAPVVCVRAYVRAGGIYEGEWLGCGISHLAEHLVAKGAVHDMGEGATDKAAKQTSDRVDEIGGQSNASTSLAMTTYYISATSSKTMDCIDLVADWLARPEITEEDFHREHGVVQRELEMGKDDPQRQMWYAHAANFFNGHPAGVPVIGYKQPLSELTYQDVLDYHAKMYVPQNMIFVVVGNVDPAAVLERTRAAFAGFGHGRSPQVTLPKVPHVTGVRRMVQHHAAVEETLEELCFRSIPLVHEDLYALDVLAYVLAEGPSSRLNRTIRNDLRLVTSIDCGSWTPEWGAGMFTVSFRAEPDKADAAEAAILDQLRDIVDNGVPEDQLSRAKRQKQADLVYSQQTAESIAATLGTDYLSTGDVNFSRNYTQRIQDVTVDDVQRVAERYFDFENMVITRLAAPPGQTAEDSPDAGPTARASRGDRLLTLPNGLRVVLRPSDAVGLVSMAMVSAGGVLLEDEQTNGMGATMADLSIKGAGSRSADEIAAFFDRAGGSIAGNCGNNSFYWQATVLEDSFDEAMEILADVIIRPHFDPEELEILRPALLARVRRQDETWHGQLSRFFRRQFYLNSPYRLLPTGSEELVANVTAEQLAAYHARNVRAGSSVLAICGRFDADAVEQRVKELFAEMPPGQVALPEPPARQVPPGGELHTLRTDNEVAAIMVAAPGMEVGDLEDRIPLDVLDAIISGWNLPSGWLHSELRGQQLVYVVHAYNWPGLAPGAFIVYAACQPPQADRVVEIIREKLDRAASYEPAQKEIDQAVNTILTAELLETQSTSALALSAALDELYGLGYDFRGQMEQLYRKVTPADVKRVGAKYLGRGYVVTVTTPLAAEPAQGAGQ